MFEFEFKILEFLQQFRNPILNEIFRFLNFFDTPYFYFIFIPMIWVGYNRKLGVRLFFILMLSFIINNFLKNLFMIPRPCQIDPSLCLINIKEYSFPSGAAQSAILIPLIFINYFKKKKWLVIVGSLYFFFISFSRLYLGVHFLSDLIGGWIVGFLLFLIYLYVFPKIEAHIVKKPVFSFWIYQCIILLLLFIPGFSKYVFALLGIFLGLFLSAEFKMFLPNSKTLTEFFIRSFFSIFGIFIFIFISYLLQKKEYMFSIYYFMGFWISFLCPFIYKKLFLKSKN